MCIAIFGQFWLFGAHFWPRTSKVYLFWPIRFNRNNEIKKIGSIWLFGKLGSPGAPEPTLGPTTPLNGPGRAKIGVNAPHVVQLTGLGPKKTNLNRSPPTSVPFTRNQPDMTMNPWQGYFWQDIVLAWPKYKYRCIYRYDDEPLTRVLVTRHCLGLAQP